MKEKSNEFDKSLSLIFKSSLFVLLATFISKVLVYVYRIIIAREFGPEVYGLFSIATIVSGFFIAFSALGLSDGILRYVSFFRGKDQMNKVRTIFWVSLKIMVLTAIVASTCLFFSSELISNLILGNGSLGIYLKIFSFVVLFTVLSYPFLSSLRAFEEITSYSFIFNVMQNLGKVGTLTLLILIGIKSQNAVAYSYVIGTFIMLILSFVICKYKLPALFVGGQVRGNEKKFLLKDLLDYSLPLLLFGIIGTIFYWIDTLSIGYLKGAIEAGFYGSAVPIAFLLYSCPEIFMQIFLPLITKEFSKNNLALVNELSKQVSKWIFAINLPVFIILIFYSSKIITLLFGEEYIVASEALQILSIGLFFASMASVSQQLLAMKGKSNLIMTNIAIASTINLILNFLLIPMKNIGFIQNEIGINGAAIATTISLLIFSSLFYLQAYKQLLIMPLRRKMINVLFSALIPLIPFYYIRTHLYDINMFLFIVVAVVYFITYLILMVLTGAFDFNDLNIIRKIARRFILKLKN